MIEEPYVGSGPILIPNILGEILAKIIEYCKHVICSAAFDKDDDELKSFVAELVNDDKPNLFSLLLVADYLGLNGLLSLPCKSVDKISCDDSEHIRKPDFT